MSDLRTPEVESLLKVLVTLDDPDQVYALLEDLLTIREIKETSQRLSVARLLADGRPYTTIAQETGASATTIARVSKALNYGRTAHPPTGRAWSPLLRRPRFAGTDSSSMMRFPACVASSARVASTHSDARCVRHIQRGIHAGAASAVTGGFVRRTA